MAGRACKVNALALIKKKVSEIADLVEYYGGRCWIRTSDPIRVKDVLYP